MNAAGIPVNRIPPLGLRIAVSHEAVVHVVHTVSLAIDTTMFSREDPHY